MMTTTEINCKYTMKIDRNEQNKIDLLISQMEINLFVKMSDSY